MKHPVVNVYIDRVIIDGDIGFAPGPQPSRFEAELREGLAQRLANGIPAGLRRSSRTLHTTLDGVGVGALASALGRARPKGNRP